MQARKCSTMHGYGYGYNYLIVDLHASEPWSSNWTFFLINSLKQQDWLAIISMRIYIFILGISFFYILWVSIYFGTMLSYFISCRNIAEFYPRSIFFESLLIIRDIVNLRQYLTGAIYLYASRIYFIRTIYFLCRWYFISWME